MGRVDMDCLADKLRCYKGPMKITLPCGEGTVPLDCPHMFVGVCEPCRNPKAHIAQDPRRFADPEAH